MSFKKIRDYSGITTIQHLLNKKQPTVTTPSKANKGVKADKSTVLRQNRAAVPQGFAALISGNSGGLKTKAQTVKRQLIGG